MKRYYLFLIAMLLGVLFIGGCDKEKNKGKETKEKETVSVIEKLDFSIKDKELSLPCNYEDIKELGFDFNKKKDKKTPIESGYQNAGVVFKNKDKEKIKIYFANTYEGTVTTEDCKIFNIVVCSDDCKSVETNNGINFNTSYEEVEKIMGKPSFLYKEDKAEFTSLKYSDSMGNASFIFKNDKLYKIEISKSKEFVEKEEETTIPESTVEVTTKVEETTTSKEVAKVPEEKPQGKAVSEVPTMKAYSNSTNSKQVQVKKNKSSKSSNKTTETSMGTLIKPLLFGIVLVVIVVVIVGVYLKKKNKK